MPGKHSVQVPTFSSVPGGAGDASAFTMPPLTVAVLPVVTSNWAKHATPMCSPRQRCHPVQLQGRAASEGEQGRAHGVAVGHAQRAAGPRGAAGIGAVAAEDELARAGLAERGAFPEISAARVTLSVKFATMAPSLRIVGVMSVPPERTGAEPERAAGE